MNSNKAGNEYGKGCNGQSVDDNEDISQSKRDMALAEFYEDQILPEGEVHVHLVLEAGDLEKAFSMPNISAGGTEEFVYDVVITSEELKAKKIHYKIQKMLKYKKSLEMPWVIV